MNYLITGAGGQLGKEWANYLQQKSIAHEAFDSAEMDITDVETVHKLITDINPHVIINCAGYTNVDQAEDEVDKAFLVNRVGVQNLCDAAKTVGAKMVHYSTDYVFSGSAEDATSFPDGYPESASVNPQNAYGKSKFEGEQILCKSDVDFLLIRVSWLCAPEGKNFVNTMLRLGSERDLLTVVDDQIGSPTYTFDLVEKTVELLRQNQSGLFHISCSGKLSWADFAEEILRMSGIKTTVRRVSSSEFKTKAKRPAFSLLSKQKIIDLGIDPLDWKSGLKQLLMKKELR